LAQGLGLQHLGMRAKLHHPAPHFAQAAGPDVQFNAAVRQRNRFCSVVPLALANPAGLELGKADDNFDRCAAPLGAECLL
jgi:hypothetical protein